MGRSALWAATLAIALTDPTPLAAALEDYAGRVGGDGAGSSGLPCPGDPPAASRGSGSGHVVHQLALSVGVRFLVH